MKGNRVLAIQLAAIFAGVSRTTVLLLSTLVLTACGGGGGGDGSGGGENPTVSIADSSTTEGNSGQKTLNFTISLSGTASNNVTGTYSTSNGTGASGAIAGSDYNPVGSADFTITAGQLSTQASVTIFGDDVVELNETFNVTLNNVQNAVVADGQAVGTILNDDSTAGEPNLSIADASTTEGNSGQKTLAFTVSLSATTTANVTGTYSTSNGSGANGALAGSDYNPVSSANFTIAAGQSSTLVNVAILGDDVVEPNETFNVTLNNVQNAVVADGQAVGTILNDDSAPTLPELRIANASIAEGNSGQSTLNFTISLSETTSSTVTGNFGTTSHTADPGSDYVAIPSASFSVPAGQLSAPISVTINGDMEIEPNETFRVDLTNVQNATVADSRAIGTIINDDAVSAMPDLSIGNASIVEGDSGQSTLSFTISLSETSSASVTGDYRTTGQTALPNQDYTPVFDEPFTVPAGQLSAQISVTILGDTDVELDETFRVDLSNVLNATVIDSQAIGTILNDDSAQTAPNLSVGNAQILEGNSGQTSLNFTVSLSAISTNDVTGNYGTTAESATVNVDYAPEPNTPFTVNAGQLSTPISVDIIGDIEVEQDETFRVDLTNVQGATVIDSRAIGTILNDDENTPAEFGLDNRPNNTVCLAPDKPTADATVVGSDPYPNANTFGPTTKLLQAPGDGSRWYVLDQDGEVFYFDVSNPSVTRSYINIRTLVDATNEGGLLGMAFHPDFPATPQVFLHYTSSGLTTNVSRFVLNNALNPTSHNEFKLITFGQPQSNHNGGDLAFGPGPAEYLFVGFGDGGGGIPASNRSQDTKNLFGAMLRIDVKNTSGTNYNIPQDNPFVGNGKCSSGSGASSCPEIYAWGLRNPYRWSFDGTTLWVGDVGENNLEEIDQVERNGNYGWDCFEGTQSYGGSCPGGPYQPPVYEYPHTNGNGSVVGGFVYRGSNIPALFGKYVFGDFLTGNIYALNDNGSGGFTRELLFSVGTLISSLARDVNGEVYYLRRYGKIGRLSPSSQTGSDQVPQELTRGNACLDEAALIPYDVNAPFWSDGAVKTRFMALPNSTNVAINESTTDDWDFPEGTVLIKSFELGGKLIETRLFMNHTNGGGWAGYTYKWNDAVTLATRVIGGETRNVNGQDWIYPSEGECLSCHTQAAGRSLGLETAQLNGDFNYPSTGRTANQVATLDHVSVFSPALQGTIASQPKLVDPASAASLTDRARAYLHTNCAQCHRPGGPTPSSMDLRYLTPLASTNTCNVAPGSGGLGISNPLIIAPTEPNRSVLLNRMNRRDSNGMPPLGSNEVDNDGVALISSWISSLGSCSP